MTQPPSLKNQPPAIAPIQGHDLSGHVAFIRSTLKEHPWEGERMQTWLSKAYEKFKPTFGTIKGEPMLLCPPPWRSTRDMPDEAVIALASAMRAAQNN